MMTLRRAAIKITLVTEDGKSEACSSYYPVLHGDLPGAMTATGKVVTSFIANLALAEEKNQTISRWLQGEG